MERLGLQELDLHRSTQPARHATRAAPELAPTHTVAEQLLRTLEGLGVDCVFGVPGGAIEPLYDALARAEQRGGARHVLARHEAGAAFMADGYARETGRLGVCFATSGPGATNLITGIASAYENDIPLLAITGQPPLPSFGSRALQESSCTGVDVLGMLGHCSHYNSLVSHPAQLPRKLAAAVMAALQRRGPAHLSIPVDVLRSAAPADLAPELAALLEPPSVLDEVAVRRLAQLLHEAGRCAIVIGPGCGEAINSLIELAELLDSHFVTTLDAKGLVHPDHPLYRGVLGFAGHDTALAALRDQVDWVLAFGVGFGEWSGASWCADAFEGRLVHIDAIEDHLRQSPSARLHVRGRLITVLERLLALLRAEPGAYQPRSNDAAGRVADPRVQQPELSPQSPAPITPQQLMRWLSATLPPQVRVFADTGNSVAWSVHYLEIRDRRMRHRRGEGPERRRSGSGWLQTTLNFAAMGWALGAAVGAALANRRCPVVCIAGDGSLLMNGQELSVAREQGLSLLLVVLNDSRLGMVHHGQRLAGAQQMGTELPTVDFALQARAMGVQAHVIESVADLLALELPALLSQPRPCLLDVRIDASQVPPIDMRLRALRGSP